MNLKQACVKVIEQSRSVGYTPTKFIQITQYGNAENLSEVISRLVLKAELLEELEKQINQADDPALTIEDLIALQEDHFNLPAEVVVNAQARSQYFNQLRGCQFLWLWFDLAEFY